MDMTIDSNIVRQLRAKANWSQEELAAASGLSLRTIQRVEKDGSAALETRRALAGAFGVDPAELESQASAYRPGEMRIGTGMLAIWVGIAWLLNLGLGIGLVGVGAVYLAGQIVRATVFRLGVLWDLVAIGCVCLTAGVAVLAGIEIRLWAILLIGVGCHLVFSQRKNKA